jgi:tetratricopeptide (TPR) repeat protein
MPRPHPLALQLLWLVLGAAAGCGAPVRMAYTADELREQLARRAPALTQGEVVVPYEVDADQVALARTVVRNVRADTDRVQALVAAMFDRKLFGLRYVEVVTASARDTLARKEGNCLGLASVFIGLARAIGLAAFYMDASTRVHETRGSSDGLTVNTGHVTAVVRVGKEDIGLDFARMGKVRWYRIIDDVEALAHFYNNRGFDLVERALAEGHPVAWEQASRDFRRAVLVLPGFARAWNNLGIAAARRGLVAEAIRDYRTAIERDPQLAAPRYNLGSLYLEEGDAAGAVALLEEAARMEPEGVHIQARLARARQVAERGRSRVSGP